MYETQDTVNMNYVYDQVMMDRELKAGGGQLRQKGLDAGSNDTFIQHGYNQKTKRESIWAKQVKPREAPKDVQFTPLTSNQVIGWRQPIDNLMSDMNHVQQNRTGICWRTFHDSGHLK